MPIPKIMPPTRLPNQKPADTEVSISRRSVHFSIENPMAQITTASMTALVISVSPVMKGSLNARTKQKRVRCMTTPRNSPNRRNPPRRG